MKITTWLRPKFMLGSCNMKKLLAIVFLNILISGNLLADHCGHDVDRSWKFTKGESYASWTFKNKTDKSIVITHIGLYSKNEKIMADVKKDISLKPFGKAYGEIYVGDLNLDVSGQGFTRCRYGTVAKKKLQPYKPKQKSGAQKWLDKIRGN